MLQVIQGRTPCLAMDGAADRAGASPWRACGQQEAAASVPAHGDQTHSVLHAKMVSAPDLLHTGCFSSWVLLLKAAAALQEVVVL